MSRTFKDKKDKKNSIAQIIRKDNLIEYNHKNRLRKLKEIPLDKTNKVEQEQSK